MNYKTEIINILENITTLSYDEIERLILIPKDNKYGDFIFPCYKLCNQVNTNPKIIAEEMNSKISSIYFERIDNVGPYLNFYINKEKYISDTVTQILEVSNSIGKSDDGNGKTIFFMSPIMEKVNSCDIEEIYCAIVENALSNIFNHRGFKVYKYKEDLLEEIIKPKILELFKKKNSLTYINSIPVISLNNYNLPPLVIEDNLGRFGNEFKEILRVIALTEKYEVHKIIYITQYVKVQSYNKVIKGLENCYFRGYNECKIVGLPIIKGYHHKLMDDKFKGKLTDLLIDKYINKKYMDKNDNKLETYMINAIIFYLLSKTKESSFYMDVEDAYILGLWDSVQSTYIKVKDIVDMYAKKSSVINNTIYREEVELSKTLEKYDSLLQKSLINLDPNLIIEYILKLVKEFNELYNKVFKNNNSKYNVPINKYNLIKATFVVLHSALEQIGIERIY